MNFVSHSAMAGFDSNNVTVVDSYDGDFVEGNARTAPDVCSFDIVGGEIILDKRHIIEMSKNGAHNAVGSETVERRTEILETVAFEKNIVAEEKASTVDEEIIVETQLTVTKCSKVDVFLEEVRADVEGNKKEAAESTVVGDSDWEIIPNVGDLDCGVNVEKKSNVEKESNVESSEGEVEMSAELAENDSIAVEKIVKIARKNDPEAAENNPSVSNLDCGDILNVEKHAKLVAEASGVELEGNGENGLNVVEIVEKFNKIVSKVDPEPTDNNSNANNSRCKPVTENAIETSEEIADEEMSVEFAESGEIVENVVENAAQNDSSDGNLNGENIPNVKQSEEKVVNDMCIEFAGVDRSEIVEKVVEIISKEDPDPVQNNLDVGNKELENILIVQTPQESVVVDEVCTEGAAKRGDASQGAVEIAWNEDPKHVENNSNTNNVDVENFLNIEKPKENVIEEVTVDMTENEFNPGGAEISRKETSDNDSIADGLDCKVITDEIVEASEQNFIEKLSKELTENGGNVVEKCVEVASKEYQEPVDNLVNDVIAEIVFEKAVEKVGDIAKTSAVKFCSKEDPNPADILDDKVIAENIVEKTEENVFDEMSMELVENGGNIFEEVIEISNKEDPKPADALDDQIVTENFVDKIEKKIDDEKSADLAQNVFEIFETAVKICSKEDTKPADILDDKVIAESVIKKTEENVVDETSAGLVEIGDIVVEKAVEIASKEDLKPFHIVDCQVIAENVVEKTEQDIDDEMSAELAVNRVEFVENFIGSSSKENHVIVENNPNVDNLDCKSIPNVKSEGDVIDDITAPLPADGGEIVENVVEIASQDDFEAVENVEHENIPKVEKSEGYIVDDINAELAENRVEIVDSIFEIASEEHKRAVENFLDVDNFECKKIPNVAKSEGNIVDDMIVQSPENRGEIDENGVEVASKDGFKAVENVNLENIPNIAKSEENMVDEMSVQLPKNRVEIVENFHEIANQELNNAENVDLIENTAVNNGVESVVHAAANNMLSDKSYVELCEGNNLEHSEQWDESLLQAKHPANAKNDENNGTKGQVHKEICMQIARSDPENYDEIESELSLVKINCEIENLAVRGLTDEIPSSVVSSDFIADDNVIIEHRKFDTNSPEESPEHENRVDVVIGEGFEAKSEESFTQKTEQSKTELVKQISELLVDENIDITEAKSTQVVTVYKQQDIVNTLVETPVNCTVKEFAVEETKMDVQIATNTQISQELSQTETVTIVNGEDETIIETVTTTSTVLTKENDGGPSEIVHEEVSVVKHEKAETKASSEETCHKEIEVNGPVVEIPDTAVQQVAMEIKSEKTTITTEAKIETPPAPPATQSSEATEVKTEEGTNKRHSMNFFTPTPFKLRTGFTKVEAPTSKRASTPTSTESGKDTTAPAKETESSVAAPREETPSSAAEEALAPAASVELAAATEGIPAPAEGTPAPVEEPQAPVEEQPAPAEEAPAHVAETQPLAEEAPTPAEEAPALGEETPAPVKETQDPDSKTPALIEGPPAPAEGPSTSAVNSPAPLGEVPTPGAETAPPEQAPGPMEETPAPEQQIPTPDEETPAPAEETLATVEETPAPADKALAPAEETPAPVEDTRAPSKETSAPVEETPAPAEETSAPAEETPAPAEETSAPAEETSAPAEETSVPAEETPAPAEETPAPAEETPAPAEATPVPAEETPAPAEEIPAPAEETLAPAEETPAPAEETPAPAEETPTPAEETPAPAEETPAPAEETPAPAEDTPAPAEEIPAPAEEIPAPAEDTPAPAEETPAPAEEIPAPAEETPAPAEETPAPAEETPAPAEDTPAPAEDTPAPAEETPAPAEEIPAPAEDTPAPAEETPAPAEQTPAPAEETPTPAEETLATAEETPAPAEETQAPAEETPAPAEETPAPAEETPAPAEETPTPAEETPAPAEETPAPAEETPAPAEETPAPAEETPAPAEDSPAPAEETPALAEETAAPAEVTPVPAEEIPAPTEETPAPADETPAPPEDTPAPVEETPARAEAPPVPAEENLAQAEETPTPGDETTAPAEETPAPEEETPAPTEETPAPGEETPAPTEETPAAAEVAPTPAEENPAPVEVANEPVQAEQVSVEVEVTPAPLAESTEKTEESTVQTTVVISEDKSETVTKTETVTVTTEVIVATTEVVVESQNEETKVEVTVEKKQEQIEGKVEKPAAALEEKPETTVEEKPESATEEKTEVAAEEIPAATAEEKVDAAVEEKPKDEVKEGTEPDAVVAVPETKDNATKAEGAESAIVTDTNENNAEIVAAEGKKEPIENKSVTKKSQGCCVIS